MKTRLLYPLLACMLSLTISVQVSAQTSESAPENARKKLHSTERALLLKQQDKKNQAILLQQLLRLSRETEKQQKTAGAIAHSSLPLANLHATASLFAASGDIYPALEQGILLNANFKAVANEISDPFDIILETYTKLADAIANNRNPEKPSTPYSIDGLAAQIDQASNTLASLPLNPVVDVTPYTVSLTELASCVTQDSAINKLHQYADAMDRAVAEAQANLDYLAKLRKAIIELNSTAQAFSKAAAIGASTPELDWTEYFSSAWWDLDQHLSPAIAHLDNTARSEIAQITTNMDRMQLQSENLKSNLQLLKPNWCILGGTWTGRCVIDQFGFKMPASLSLTNSGTQGGALTLDGTIMSTQSVAISSKVNLTVTMGQAGVPPRIFQGAFDNTYQKFIGKLAIPDEPGLASSCILSGRGY